MRSITASAVLVGFVGLGTAAAPVSAQEGAIQDNSFLVEEAYNQEAGVVQHISVLELARRGGDWSFDFTQEWPAPNMRHQLSYTVPMARVEGASGLGDVAINYRYQLLGEGGGPLAVAPRLSVLLPTGDSDEGLGGGGGGVEVNLPVSLVAAERFVAHWNLGGSRTFNADGEGGEEADLDGVFAAQGLIWLARPTFNLMLEARWDRAETLAAGGRIDHDESFVVSPGARLAQNLGDLQIVYGLAFPMEVGAGDGEKSALFYLSFEHPFAATP
ncbi:MAG TPA: transporter [Thermoanaerobaculia bacterium]|nr:transporter [Thermoanaerobaculia bacterium]